MKRAPSGQFLSPPRVHMVWEDQYNERFESLILFQQWSILCEAYSHFCRICISLWEHELDLYLGRKQVGSVLWAAGWAGFVPPATCLSFQLLPIERAARKQKAQEAVAG